MYMQVQIGNKIVNKYTGKVHEYVRKELKCMPSIAVKNK